ncbi:MAG: F-box protein, partial [Kistimonas sp.]|nr:F-box protein [Kistimonas sp.]
MSFPVTPTPRAPASPPEAAALRLATAFGQPVAPELPRPTGLAAAATSTQLQLPGRDISRWPCQLLELVLCHLDAADLARASQTCRQWHAAASRPGLQVHCFMNAYPAYYRHQLQQTLDPVAIRQLLSLCPPPQPEAGTALERRPVSHLFYELTRRMLAAEHIRADDSNLGLLCASEYNTMYSPDGRYLVSQHPVSHTGQVPCLSIWRRETRSL